MILDDENILIGDLESDYISYIDHLHKNMNDYDCFVKDALKILNEHKFTPYGAWKYKHGIFEFLTDNDPYNLPLVNISCFYYRKPIIGFANIKRSYDFKKYHNITKEDYKKLIDEFKQQYSDRADYCGGVILK